MNKAPSYLTLLQKKSFYSEDLKKQGKVINLLVAELKGFPHFIVGDMTHMQIVRTRVKLTAARELRDKIHSTLWRVNRRIKNKEVENAA